MIPPTISGKWQVFKRLCSHRQRYLHQSSPWRELCPQFLEELRSGLAVRSWSPRLGHRHFHCFVKIWSYPPLATCTQESCRPSLVLPPLSVIGWSGGQCCCCCSVTVDQSTQLNHDLHPTRPTQAETPRRSCCIETSRLCWMPQNPLRSLLCAPRCLSENSNAACCLHSSRWDCSGVASARASAQI